MSWHNVTIIGLLLAASVALVALGQATIAGGLITAAVSTVALFTRLGSIKDRAPRAEPEAPEDAPHGDE